MILVDTELRRRAEAGAPIRVGVVGAGFSARMLSYHIAMSCPGLRITAVANRTPGAAVDMLERAGVDDIRHGHDTSAVDEIIEAGGTAVVADHEAMCGARNVDVVVEATGTVEHGARVALTAIEAGKHLVLLNVELDATVGPILKRLADERGVVFTNTDGDEPGVAMNLIRYVRSLGLEPRVSGNLKGLYDPYRNPDTQKDFAARYGQKPQAVASYADGTKLSMELTVLANGAGFGVARRGMYGPRLTHVSECADFFGDKPLGEGIVDFTCGAAPGNGAFVLGWTDDPVRRDYLKYLKMGDGPLYVFYTPFHLPQLEISNTIGRAVLFGDATVAPVGSPRCEAIAVAKRDLKPGEVLDGLGGFCVYALIDNYPVARAENLLPVGISEGCVVTTSIPKDQALTYEDVELPARRVCDELRQRQSLAFGG